MAGFPQFKIRKVSGITEIRMADDPALRQEMAKLWAKYAPLLSEQHSIPSFEDLKSTREVAEYITTQGSAGKSFTFTLEVHGSGDRIIGKKALLVDLSGKVCAVSAWTPESGTVFSVTN